MDGSDCHGGALPRLLEAAGAQRRAGGGGGRSDRTLAGWRSNPGSKLDEALPSDGFGPAVGCAASHWGAVLALFGAAAAAAPFTMLHGAGSGIFTIARGTVPLAIFGPENYGYRLGLLGAPTRVATAAAPLLFGVLIDRYGAGVPIFSSALSIAAFAALCFLPISQTR